MMPGNIEDEEEACPVKTQRCIAIFGLLIMSVLASGCPTPPPRYVPKSDAGPASLPASPAELVGMADKLVAGKKLVPLEKADQARQALERALPKHPTQPEVHWRIARACFLMTRSLKNSDQRVEIARKGMAHAKKMIAAHPKRVEGHYYLALNMAKIAEAKWKLSLIKPMVAAGEKARQIDERYDSAGPLVFLGKVFLDAPAWPVSVGNTEKALKLLERAVKLAPLPESRVFLGQAYHAEEMDKEAREQLTQALASKDLEPKWRKVAKKTLAKLDD
jgi:tetratricopeptide (TPR) repeat protein